MYILQVQPAHEDVPHFNIVALHHNRDQYGDDLRESLMSPQPFFSRGSDIGQFRSTGGIRVDGILTSKLLYAVTETDEDATSSHSLFLTSVYTLFARCQKSEFDFQSQTSFFNRTFGTKTVVKYTINRETPSQASDDSSLERTFSCSLHSVKTVALTLKECWSGS
ncbi:MAG: hypothetical protein S4CHLAM6_13760 [Chlamydiae bacterium]|nr:hypothetical protein [Chlamydiota bacterium]